MTTLVTDQVARSKEKLRERRPTYRTERRRDAAHDSVLPNGGELFLLTALAIGACSPAPSATAPNSPASPVSLNVVAGSAQHAPVNTALPQPIRVQVLDNSGHPVPNFLLNFVVTSGGGHVFGGVEQTNSSGYADEQWTLGPRLGPQTLEARQVNSWTGVAASYGKFTATGTPPNNVPVVTTSGPTGLAVMNADGSGMQPVELGATGLVAQHPQLSPDHKQVLFDAPRGAFKASASGFSVTSVPTNIPSPQDSHPMWSPDGVDFLVAYLNGDLTAVIATNGPLPFTSFCDGAQWSYSADGTKLVYTFVGSPSCANPAPLGVFVRDVDDTVITPPGAPRQQAIYGTEILVGGSDPAWSPDGQHIAVTYNGHTAVMDPDGNNVKIILNKSYGRVSWSPDSQLWAVDSGYVNVDGTNYVAVKGCPCTFAWR
jgi:WD40-like Beta Propeller Repeat